MISKSFKGLNLQKAGNPLCFSFVTYTPQSREQMITSGDLDQTEEYLNPVTFDFFSLSTNGMLTGLLRVVRGALARDTGWWMKTGTSWTC